MRKRATWFGFSTFSEVLPSDREQSGGSLTRTSARLVGRKAIQRVAERARQRDDRYLTSLASLAARWL